MAVGRCSNDNAPEIARIAHLHEKAAAARV